jgi:hypothetical protein
VTFSLREKKCPVKPGATFDCHYFNLAGTLPDLEYYHVCVVFEEPG